MRMFILSVHNLCMLMYVQNMKFRRNRFLGIPNVVCIGKTKCTSIIDPYLAAAILDLKRDWTGISNVLKINYAS